MTFLGKKLRSKPWSQRRTERLRRELLGGCGYTTHFLGFFPAGTAGDVGKVVLDDSAAGSGKHSSAWPAAAMVLCEVSMATDQLYADRGADGGLMSRGGASVSKKALC